MTYAIITICGSTRFREEMLESAEILTAAGWIVLMPNVMRHEVNEKLGYYGHAELTPELKERLDEMHLEKIRRSDAIFVVDVDDYVGESTSREIAYAERLERAVYRWTRAYPVPLVRRKRRDGDQPLPPPVPDGETDAQSLVMRDIADRRQVGISRYGAALQTWNGRDNLLDLYEELLDGAIYARNEMERRNDLIRALRHVYACPREPFACDDPTHELAARIVSQTDGGDL